MSASVAKQPTFGLSILVAWRSLWRNKKRTYLTAGAIGVGIVLIQLMMAFQTTYSTMIDVGTRFGSGHLQIQAESFQDDPRVDKVVEDADQLLTSMLEIDGVVDGATVGEVYALVSNEEKSFGAIIVGVHPTQDQSMTLFPQNLVDGSFLALPDDAFVGSAIARNLGLSVGDELVVVGSDIDGSVAAAVFNVGGIFETGNAALDRSMVRIQLAKFREIFGLGDAAHRISLMVEDPENMDRALTRIDPVLPQGTQLVDWHMLAPDVSQNIKLDKIGNLIFQVAFVLIIVLSISNTFVMKMFERTREFGMLQAIGMRIGAIFRMLMVETVFLWIVGCAISLILAVLSLTPMILIGIPLGGEAAEQISASLSMPSRLYPGVDAAVALVAPIVIGVSLVATAALCSLRLYKLNVIESLRHEN